MDRKTIFSKCLLVHLAKVDASSKNTAQKISVRNFDIEGSYFEFAVVHKVLMDKVAYI